MSVGTALPLPSEFRSPKNEFPPRSVQLNDCLRVQSVPTLDVPNGDRGDGAGLGGHEEFFFLGIVGFDDAVVDRVSSRDVFVILQNLGFVLVVEAKMRRRNGDARGGAEAEVGIDDNS